MKALLTFMLMTLASCSVAVDAGKQKPAGPIAPGASAVAVTTSVSIPSSAQLVAQGASTVAYTADSPGTLYVFVRADRSTPFVSDYQTGESFTLSATPAKTTYTTIRRSGGARTGTLPVSPAGYELYFLHKTSTTTTAPAADGWLRRRGAVSFALKDFTQGRIQAP